MRAPAKTIAAAQTTAPGAELERRRPVRAGGARVRRELGSLARGSRGPGRCTRRRSRCRDARRRGCRARRRRRSARPRRRRRRGRARRPRRSARRRRRGAQTAARCSRREASRRSCSASSTRTTRRPASPSERGRVFVRMASMKCSHSSRSGSRLSIARAADVARAGDVLAVGARALRVALVVDGDLALDVHVVEGRHALGPNDGEAAFLVRVQPREVQVGGEAGREAQEAEDDVLDPLAHVGLAARLDLVRLLLGEVQDHRHVVGAERPERVLVGPELAEVEPVRVDVVDVAEVAGGRRSP